MDSRHLRLFLRFTTITLVMLYLVVLAGSVVRATGSGMGCPDWPKCFGHFIPPTDVSQLPPDYKERFAVAGKPVADFNALHTWVESVNRWIGALSGMTMLLAAFYAFRLRREKRSLFLLSLFALFLFGLTAWMGKVVVGTNLQPLMITLHMVNALATIAVAIALITQGKQLRGDVREQLSPALRRAVFAAIALTFAQVILGTQVREGVDTMNEQMSGTHRETWLAQLGAILTSHRIMAWPVLLLNVWIFYRLRKFYKWDFFHKLGLALLLLVAAEFAAGLILFYFDLPAFAQPAHMLLAAILFGVQFALLASGKVSTRE